jgi:hypothetical protein
MIMMMKLTSAVHISQSSHSHAAFLICRALNRRATKILGPMVRMIARAYCSSGVCVGVWYCSIVVTDPLHEPVLIKNSSTLLDEKMYMCGKLNGSLFARWEKKKLRMR